MHLGAHSPADIGVSIISFHEQVLGRHAYLNRARTRADLVRGYDFLETTRVWFARLNVVPFDDAAGAVRDTLRGANLRVGAMDLRIAAIALAWDVTVVTRNAAHFSRVPGLRIEDWTR